MNGFSLSACVEQVLRVFAPQDDRPARFAFKIRFAGLFIAALLTVAGPARGQRLFTGRAIFSYQVFGSENLDSRNFHQIYDVDYQRNVTEPFRLHLSFRGEGTNGSQEASGFQSSNSLWQLRPLGELTYSLPALTLRGRYELFQTRASFDSKADRQQTERIRADLAWNPEDLPALTLYGQRRKDVDHQAGLDQREDQAFQSLRYVWRGLTLGDLATYSDFTIGGTGFNRKTATLQGQLRYENSLEGGRLSVNGGATGGGTRIDESGGPGTSVNVPTQVPITAALYARDDTPLDSRDNPLIPAPRLIDGDLARGAGIVVGGQDALTYQNIAVDLGRVAPLDTLRVYVRDTAGSPVPFGGLVRWDVFTSGEGLDWTPMKGGAQSRFVGALSAYEITFVKTSSRFFKVVSFGTVSVEAVVTEIQAFFHTEFSQSTKTRRTDLRFVTADLNVSGRPTQWLTLRYSGLFNDFKTAQPDRPEFNTRDTDHVASLEVQPSRPLNVTVRYEKRSFTSEGTTPQTLDGYWGIVRYAPDRNLSSSLEANRTTEHGTVELSADTLRLSQYIRLFRAVELTADGGLAREEFPLQSLSDRRLFANAVSYIQLTRAIRLTLAVNYQRTRFSGEGSLALPAPETTDSRYYGEVFFRPSSQLLLSGRLGYVTSAFFSGTTKTYRVEWYPFAQGTIRIGTVYDEDIETNATYRRFRRVQFLPQWLINRDMTLGVNYNYLTLLDRGTGVGPAVESKTKQLYVTLSWTL